MKVILAAAVAAAALIGLSACDRGSEAARSHADSGSGGSSSSASSGYTDTGSRSSGSSYVASRGGRSGDRGDEGERSYRKREAVPDFHGEPLWSDNRKHTAEENAHYHCDKSGPDIGAKGYDDCLTKVHAFLDHPPSGAKTLTRANGDKLVYDPQANMFAVARKDGAPRTFFKPRDGAQYWTQQQAEADNPRGYRSRRSGGYAGADRSGDGGGE